MISLNRLGYKIFFPFRNVSLQVRGFCPIRDYFLDWDVPALFGFGFQNYLWEFITRYDISIFFFGRSVSKSVRSLKCFRVLRLVYKVCEVLGICLEICKWFEILGLSAQV